jgi:HAD superfamily hydrolase (TIGR01549 family)
VDPNAVKVVAFDCDGVLFDSTLANQSYYNHILNHFGLPVMSEAQFAFVHMHTADESVAHLIADPDTLAAANQYRKELSYLPFIRHMVVEPHLHDLLARLRPQFKTAIATNRTDTMERVLFEHELEADFDLVVTAQDVRHPKPHPECLQAILNHFNLNTLEMVYIGDSELDAIAARRAGVPFIAYANNALEADFYIDRLSQVADLLNLDGQNVN